MNNANDTKKTQLIKALRQVIETAATTLQHVALDEEQDAASMLSVTAMYVADAVGAMTGDEAAARTMHLASHQALALCQPSEKEALS